jgi:hypothetical protein
MSETLRDVYTAEEVARAAGVPVKAVNELIAAGEVRRIAGTLFLSAEQAVQAGRRLKERRTAAALALAVAAAPEPLFARVVQKSRFADRQRGAHAAASSAMVAVSVVPDVHHRSTASNATWIADEAAA